MNCCFGQSYSPLPIKSHRSSMLAIMRMKSTPSYSYSSLGGGRRNTTSTKRIICATAAATFGTLSSSSPCCWAFVASPSPPISIVHHPIALHSNSKELLQNNIYRTHQLYLPPYDHQQQSRLFFSQKGNNNNDDNSDWETFKRAGANLLAKGAEKVKSFLPFGKSEEEKRADIIKKERKEEITGGIQTLIKDLPLPIRMMGRMVTPLLTRAAEEIAEQTQQAQDVFEEARVRLMNDPYIAESLGTPIQVGQPFSQSSSTVVINGQRSATVRASFPVAGSRGSGIATLESSNGDIRSLTVNVNGRTLSVGSSRRGGGDGGMFNSKSTSNSKGDNIIEAEIIEKK
ncbi:hypothetical protein ACHAXH_000492 [Discostella pseudostelligera]